LQFSFQRLRFHFAAEQELCFPADKPGNLLRGALGTALRPFAERYQRVFAPRLQGGPSGLVNLPRPFVLRAAHLDGKRLEPGSRFTFDVHVFDKAVTEWVASALASLAAEGMGPHRSRVVFRHVDQEELCFDLGESERPVSRVRMQFVTPTEVKTEGGCLAEPLFVPLISRIRDRISNLMTFYGGGELQVDFAGFGERAGGVAMTECSIERTRMTRFSTRTGQRHPFGGFTGWATYAGDLSIFIPFLRVAQYTGVGRQTSWGKGQIRLLDDGSSDHSS
jgi:hypothetical protein